jgi:hypothetical protein
MYRRDSPFHIDERSHADTITLRFRSPETILQGILKRIQDVADKQEKLSKSREGLLARRERARASSKNIQAKRSAAGDAEAAFMDYIRDFMSSATTPSFQMIDLYNKVETARNDLGALEADHQQLERNLTGADWMFKEEEDEFYQYGLSELFEDLLVDPDQDNLRGSSSILVGPQQMPPPSHFDTELLQGPQNQTQITAPPPQSPAGSAGIQLATLEAQSLPSRPLRTVPRIIEPDSSTGSGIKTELDGLGKQFGSASLPEPDSLEAKDLVVPIEDSLLRPESPLSSTSPVSTILASDQYSRGLSSNWLSEADTDGTANNTHLVAQTSSIARRLSDPTSFESKNLAIPLTLERSLSENAAHNVHRGRAVKNRVRAWLMSLLEHNPMEKTLYYNILEATLRKHGFHYPDYEPWGVPATQYWARDSRSSFETDPLDKSSTTVETFPEPRPGDGLDMLPIGTEGDGSPNTDSIRPGDLSRLPRSLTDAAYVQNDLVDPATSSIIPPGRPSPEDGERNKIEPQTGTDTLNLNVPKITIARPQDDASLIPRQAVANPLPSSPVYGSCNPATLFQYRLDVHSAQCGSDSASCRSFFRDYILPRRKRRSHSMSSLTHSHEATLKLKRTLSKDGA